MLSSPVMRRTLCALWFAALGCASSAPVAIEEPVDARVAEAEVRDASTPDVIDARAASDDTPAFEDAALDVTVDAPLDASNDAPLDAPRDALADVTRDAALDVTRDVSPADAGAARPSLATRWHIDLEAPVNVNVDADWFDIDLFDNDASVVAALHARGRRVVCYFSAGSGEDWRPDYRGFASAALGDPLAGWPGERWLDVRAASVRAVMQRRLDLARTRGCDGVDPDNVDGYANATGFSLRASDQLAYNRFLASEAHARGLVIGLKNDLDQIPSLVADFDFAINEACFMYSECATLAPFVRAGKSVLQIEYGAVSSLAPRVCPMAASMRLFTILPGADRLNGSYRRCLDGRDIR
jgi:hypothetical protein